MKANHVRGNRPLNSSDDLYVLPRSGLKERL